MKRAPSGAGGFLVGSLFGVRIYVHPSWLFVFAFGVLAIGSSGVFVTSQPLSDIDAFLLAPVAIALYFVCVLAHELSHALVARARGVNVDEITLFVFGGAARLDQEAPSAGSEFLITIAGPITSAVLGAAIFSAGFLFVNDSSDLAAEVATEMLFGLGLTNLALAAFHMVPAFPMDGGRLLRSVLWLFGGDFLKATRRATKIGRALAFFLMGVGFAVAVGYDPIIGLWAVLVGWFLYRAAEGSYRRVELEQLVEGVVVRDVMDRDVAVVSPNLTLDTFVDQHELEGGAGLYPVTMNGGLVGTIDIDQVHRVPKASWPRTRITDVMSRIDSTFTLTEPQPAMDAVGRFQSTRVPAIAVVDVADRRRLLGLVTREGLVRALRLRETLRGG